MSPVIRKRLPTFATTSGTSSSGGDEETAVVPGVNSSQWLPTTSGVIARRERVWRTKHQQQQPPRLRKPSGLPFLLVVNIATLAALFHCGHVATMYENHISFSLLSNLEREMTFRSEAGFYYSFYKQVSRALFLHLPYFNYFRL